MGLVGVGVNKKMLPANAGLADESFDSLLFFPVLSSHMKYHKPALPAPRPLLPHIHAPLGRTLDLFPLSSLPLLLPSLPQPLENLLTILIQLQFGNYDFTRRNSQRYALPVRLLARHSLNVDHVFETVDRCDFAFAAFVAAACDEDFVVAAEGDGSDLLMERGLLGCGTDG